MTKIIIHEAFMINPGNAIPDKGSWGKKCMNLLCCFPVDVFPASCSCSLRTTATIITISIIGCLCLSGYHGGRHRVWVGRHPLSDGLCDAAARSHGRGAAALQPGHQAQVSGPAGFVWVFFVGYLLRRLLFLLHEVQKVLESPLLFQLRVERNKMFVVKFKNEGFLPLWRNVMLWENIIFGNVCCSTSV